MVWSIHWKRVISVPLVTEPIPNPQSLIPGLFRSLIPGDPQSLVPSFANAVVSALLAPACAVCDVILDEPLSGCVCRGCWGAVRFITPPLCDVCGDPLPRPIERCRQCSSRRSVLDGSRAIGEYDGALREIIHVLKYRRRRSLARPLAALMQSRGKELLERADCIVPVPLHWRREHQRGFNQARELARHLELPLVDALVRKRHTRPQVELAATAGTQMCRLPSYDVGIGLVDLLRSKEQRCFSSMT